METESNEVDVAKMIDQHRWLLNNGLLTDSVKNQLFFCGSIVHKDVQAVEVNIEPEKKLVDYIIYVDKSLIRKIQKYQVLSTSTSLFNMWRFKRFLKKEGCLDFEKMLTKLVSDYCGPKWTAKATILDFAAYVDGFEDESSRDEESNRPSNSR